MRSPRRQPHGEHVVAHARAEPPATRLVPATEAMQFTSLLLEFAAPDQAMTCMERMPPAGDVLHATDQRAHSSQSGDDLDGDEAIVSARESMHFTPAAGGHLHADEASILSLLTEQAGHAMHVAPRMTCMQVTR